LAAADEHACQVGAEGIGVALLCHGALVQVLTGDAVAPVAPELTGEGAQEVGTGEEGATVPNGTLIQVPALGVIECHVSGAKVAVERNFGVDRPTEAGQILRMTNSLPSLRYPERQEQS
jgi:hypothetical protein